MVLFSRQTSRRKIGMRYGKDLQIEVLDVIPKLGGSQYKIKCHTCAKDPELYGDATKIIPPTVLKRGVPQCGCSEKYVYTKEQHEIIINRLVQDRGWKFIGFVDKVRTDKKIIMHCSIHNHKWTPVLSNILKCAGGCVFCGRERHKSKHAVDESIAIDKFKASGRFSPNTKFRQNKDPSSSRSVWYQTCPDCTDEYTEYETTYHYLTKGLRRCKCDRQRMGYDVNKNGTFYILRATSDALDFTGFGISNNLNERLIEHRKNLRRTGFTISEMETFELSGKSALSLENSVKKKFPRFSQDVPGFIWEATYYWLYDDVIAFAEDFTSDTQE